MTKQKRFLKTLLISFLLILLGIEFYMEIRYPCDELVLTSKNTESILRQVPQVEITEEDRAMVKEVFQCTAVQELLESGENGDFSATDYPELAETAGGYLGAENAESVVASVFFYEGRPSLYINWRDSDNRMFNLGKSRDGAEWDYYKIYAPKRKTIYENWDNGQAHKTVLRRRWFAWLRDGI